MSNKNFKAKQHGYTEGYRSGLEEDNRDYLRDLGVNFEYEQRKIKYLLPEKTYTPDFELLDNGIIVETKGRFTGADRTKHLTIKRQHPDLDIRFVFQNPNAKLSKRSNTTYAQWAEKNGFQWAKGLIPKEWIDE